MRMLHLAVIVACAAAGLAAQTASTTQLFVRPVTGQTPPYSPAIKAGGVVSVSGQLPTDDNGKLVAGDFTGQARQVFDNLRHVLTQAGTSLDQVVHVNLMLQNASDFPALDAIYRQQFKSEFPARTTVVGEMVAAGAPLEIQVTAVMPGAEREAILPADWATPTSPYNYAIKSGDTLYMSGLVSRKGTDNTAVTGDIGAQTTLVMENAGAILKAAGMGVSPPGAYDVEITFVAIKGPSPREVIIPARPDGTPGQAGPNYSPAIRVGNRLFVSGGSGTTDTNKSDMKSQTTEAFAKVGAAIRAAGFDNKDVVASDVYIADTKKFGDMNEAYRAISPNHPPVRATLGDRRLANADALIEAMVMAVK